MGAPDAFNPVDLDDAGGALEQALVLRRPEPCAIVIFGALGDLAHRKLFPALYALWVRKLLPEKLAIVGLDLKDVTLDQFKAEVRESVKLHGRDTFSAGQWRGFSRHLRFVKANGSGLKPLTDELAKVDTEEGTEGNRVYYLAVPPKVMEGIVTELGKKRDRKGFTRLIVEKPFGNNRLSAERLNKLVLRYFDEQEVFRIDHYLGKTTVENISVLRWANPVFDPIWNRLYIDQVQITVAEDIGIEGRASFYEQAGAIRDVFQNHALQLLTLTAMEAPFDLKADSVRNEKVKVLGAMFTPGPKHVVRGQYGAGIVDGKVVPGYREEEGVASNSMTDTFIAAKLFVDNQRWADVPFYVRTGKRLPKRETTISIFFKKIQYSLFKGHGASNHYPNVLTIRVQPDDGVVLSINAKSPGQGLGIQPVRMDFPYASLHADLPEAYERLVLDCLLGDAALFTRADEVEEQWAIVDAITSAWERDPTEFPNYAAGSWGPQAAADLINRDGRWWTD